MNRIITWYKSRSKGFRFFFGVICLPLWGPPVLLILLLLCALFGIPAMLFEKWEDFK